MIKVKNDWWKNFFNHIYLITDARSVCNAELTSQEVDLLEKTLSLNKKDPIGQYSIHISARQFHNPFGLAGKP